MTPELLLALARLHERECDHDLAEIEVHREFPSFDDLRDWCEFRLLMLAYARSVFE